MGWKVEEKERVLSTGGQLLDCLSGKQEKDTRVQGFTGFKTQLCVYSCACLFIYARMSFVWGAWMNSSNHFVSRVRAGDIECSQLTVHLRVLGEKREFSRKGISSESSESKPEMSQQCSHSKVCYWKSTWLATNLRLGCHLIARQPWYCKDGPEKHALK